jgi:hypothetical protein
MKILIWGGYMNTSKVNESYLNQLKTTKIYECDWSRLAMLFKLEKINEVKNAEELSLHRYDQLKEGYAKNNALNIILGCTRLKSLSMDGCSQLTEEVVNKLLTSKELEKLKLIDCKKITGEKCDSIVKLVNLKYMDLSYSGLTDNGFEKLEPLSNLSTLILSFCLGLTSSSNKTLRKFTNLTHLDVSGCKELFNENLKGIEKLNKLEYLNLNFCRDDYDGRMDGIEKLSNLKTLLLSYWDGLSDFDLESLKEMQQLKFLELRNSRLITKIGLKALIELTNLKVDLNGRLMSIKEHLEANENEKDFSDSNTSDIEDAEEDLGTVSFNSSKEPKLILFNLDDYSEFNDYGFTGLKQLTYLIDLDLSYYNDLTEDDFYVLKELTQIKVLNLSNQSTVTNTTLNLVAKLTQLDTLILNSCEQLDGLSSIENLEKLSHLELSNCPMLTDESLNSLLKLKSLIRLEIYCRQLDQKNILEIKRNLGIL